MTGAEVPEAHAIELVNYLLGNQNTDGDGQLMWEKE